MGCTLGIRIIHLQEDLLPKSADSKNRIGIQKVIHDDTDVLTRVSPDITPRSTDVQRAESLPGTSASIGHLMSGELQEATEMFPSICKVPGKKPPSLQNTRGVTFPSIAFPCSPRKSRTLPMTTAALASSERESIRMRALRGLIQKQLSDVTDGRRSRLPPICPSKLRKSSSCNDSWLQEIMESDEVAPDFRLPAINEVDPTGAESKLLSSVMDALPSSRSVSMRSLQTRSSWLTSCSNAKRATVSVRDRSPMASMENPRLPVILEDLDLGSSPKKVSSKSLDGNALDTPQSRSLLQVPKMAIPAENSVWLAVQSPGEVPVAGEQASNHGTAHGYSRTMAEVLGLNDNSCTMDSDILENMTFDPSSPLLVSFMPKESNGNATEMPDTSKEQNSGVGEGQEDSINGNTLSAMEDQDTSSNKEGPGS